MPNLKFRAEADAGTQAVQGRAQEGSRSSALLLLDTWVSFSLVRAALLPGAILEMNQASWRDKGPRNIRGQSGCS